jgi:mannose-6-phosphate isomerase-like protein (cupin superfamily)
MAYGLTLDQVRQINQPQPVPEAWGATISLTRMPQFSMFRLNLLPGAAQPLHLVPGVASCAFVESGEAILRHLDDQAGNHAGLVRAGEVISLQASFVHGWASPSGASLYLFSPRLPDALQPIQVETQEAALRALDSLDPAALPHLGQPTTDVREKYWGRIETIASAEDIAAKRIFVRKGGQSSLEYHVEKSESYYIHSGLLKVGLRIGRAENRSIVMMAGQSYDVHPGVMHMRIGLEDTVILEVSTRDSDSDSYLVEDGQTYRHIDVDSLPITSKQEQPA